MLAILFSLILQHQHLQALLLIIIITTLSTEFKQPPRMNFNFQVYFPSIWVIPSSQKTRFSHTNTHTLEYGCITKTCKLLLFIKNLSQEQNKQKNYADASVSQWRKNLYENFYSEISILDKFNLCIKMNSGNNRLNREKN